MSSEQKGRESDVVALGNVGIMQITCISRSSLQEGGRPIERAMTEADAVMHEL